MTRLKALQTFLPNLRHYSLTCNERFTSGRVMMIGTLDDPSLVKVDTHMFADEAISWVTYPENHLVYAKHRINEDGTPAPPLSKATGN